MWGPDLSSCIIKPSPNLSYINFLKEVGKNMLLWMRKELEGTDRKLFTSPGNLFYIIKLFFKGSWDVLLLKHPEQLPKTKIKAWGRSCPCLTTQTLEYTVWIGMDKLHYLKLKKKKMHEGVAWRVSFNVWQHNNKGSTDSPKTITRGYKNIQSFTRKQT